MNKNISNNNTIINRIKNLNDSKTKNKKQNNENRIRKTKCSKKHNQKIIFTFPPKKSFTQYKSTVKHFGKK